ncbi:uncharacterized protein [Procambarus clarkii]|uniref:uncharacterized protein isoform X3 n=1 Tax=Procambarus clarkii TaxID=6728 RepID=UPI0037427BD2
MGGATSSLRLHQQVMNEIISIGNILEHMQNHNLNAASLGGMVTVYIIFDFALRQVKMKHIMKETDEQYGFWRELPTMNIDEAAMIKNYKRERMTGPNLDSIMIQMNEVWNKTSEMEEGASVFLLKLLDL